MSSRIHEPLNAPFVSSLTPEQVCCPPSLSDPTHNIRDFCPGCVVGYHQNERLPGLGNETTVLGGVFCEACHVGESFLYKIPTLNVIVQRGQHGKSRKNEEIRPDVCLDRVIPPACPVYWEKVAGSRNINLVISQDQKLVILICSTTFGGWRRKISTSFLQSVGIWLAGKCDDS